MTQQNCPLNEKWRPSELDSVIGIGAHIETFKRTLLNPCEMNNLLFWGPAGVGKTTCAKIIINKLGADVLKINGSDKTGVDTIRDRVFNFVVSMSSEPGIPKIVWIEEADFLSQPAQGALRAMIEQFHRNARFIFTCNFIDKLTDPVRSRFSEFHIGTPPLEECLDRIKYVCEQEKITATEDVLKFIIEKHNRDMRAIINTIQTLSSNKKKEISSLSLTTLKNVTDEVFELLNDLQWTEIRYKIATQALDFEKILVEIEKKFFYSDRNITIKGKVTDIISSGMLEMKFSFDKEISFSAIMYRIIRILEQ